MSSSTKSRQAKPKASDISESKNWLEWLVFGVSCCVIIGTISALIYFAISSNGRPVRVDVKLGEGAKVDGHYRVPVTVQNVGGQSLEHVRVEVTLFSGGEDKELSQLDFDYLPAGGEQEGVALFNGDPGAHASRLVSDVTSYQQQ